MARNRTISPTFPHIHAVGRLSRDARLFFILLWTQADDSGRLRLDFGALGEQLFPSDLDAPVLLPGWLDELETARCVERYGVEGIEYLRVLNWRKLQKVDHPGRSHLPRGPSEPESRETREDRPRMPMARGSEANPRETAFFFEDGLDLPGTPGEFPPERRGALLEIALRKSLAAPNGQTATARLIELSGKIEQQRKAPNGERSRSPSPAELHGLPETA